MKKIFFVSILILFGNSFVIAQNFKLKVISENAPLPYAYVYINGQAYCSADSTGFALIPISLLKTGDTLSASFVGTKNNHVVYDNNLALKGECTIDLEQTLALEQTVVIAKDRSMEYFRKYVNIRYIGFWFDELRGDFVLNLTNNTDPSKVIAGTFVSRLLPNSYKKATGEQELTIILKSDTLGLDKTLKGTLSTALQIARGAVYLSNRGFINIEMRINYKGEKNGKRVFLITRSKAGSNNYFDTFQTLVYVDKVSKEITSSEISILMNNSTSYRNETSTINLIDEKSKTLYPSKIYSKSSYWVNNEKRVWSVEFNNITFHKNTKKYKLK